MEGIPLSQGEKMWQWVENNILTDITINIQFYDQPLKVKYFIYYTMNCVN